MLDVTLSTPQMLDVTPTNPSNARCHPYQPLKCSMSPLLTPQNHPQGVEEHTCSDALAEVGGVGVHAVLAHAVLHREHIRQLHRRA